MMMKITDELINEFKAHIQYEDGMDDSMYRIYLEYASQYVERATNRESKLLIFLVAGVLNDFRVPEKDFGDALNAMTPFFIQEALSDETADE